MAKVIVADDSLTIQKVVGITLANMDWELVQCLSEADLLDMTKSGHFDLILLDFNLSDNKTGYDVVSAVRKNAPETPIMVMLGTFDSVDENQMSQVGIQDKIVKPFESSKFIKKCQELIEAASETEDMTIESNIEESESGIEAVGFEAEEDVGNQWVVDSPEIEDKSDEGPMPEGNFLESENYKSEERNPLESELEGWGIQMPGVIGTGNKATVQMPPVIEGAVNSFAGSILETEKNVAVDDSKQEVISLEESKVPSEEDLAFPEPFSKLVPLDELSKEESSSLDLNIEPEDSFNLDTENLAKEVEEDVSVDEFWAIDGGDQSALHMETDQPVDIEEITFEAQSDEKPADAPQISTNPTSAEAIDQKELVEALKQALTPVVEQFVKEYCSKKIEQVAWEVIPDLAENLIRSEIKEISQTIKSQ